MYSTEIAQMVLLFDQMGCQSSRQEMSTFVEVSLLRKEVLNLICLDKQKFSL